MSTTMTMSAPTLADLMAQHSRCDSDYDRALDAGDAQRMIAARSRKEDLADEIKVALLLQARDAVATAATELEAAMAEARGFDTAAMRALDERDAAYRDFEAKSEALNRIEMDRQFSRNRIEMARRAQEAARQRLAKLANGAAGGAA